MKFRLAEKMKRLNVEHRTPNIERRILITLKLSYRTIVIRFDNQHFSWHSKNPISDQQQSWSMKMAPGRGRGNHCCGLQIPINPIEQVMEVERDSSI